MLTDAKNSGAGNDQEIGVIEAEFAQPSTANHTDIGHALYKEALDMDPTERDIIAKRVLRKLDFIVLPMVSYVFLCQFKLILIFIQMCFVYFLSFLDKSTLNYANAYGLQADLHLVGREYCASLPFHINALRTSWTDAD